MFNSYVKLPEGTFFWGSKLTDTRIVTKNNIYIYIAHVLMGFNDLDAKGTDGHRALHVSTLVNGFVALKL